MMIRKFVCIFCLTLTFITYQAWAQQNTVPENSNLTPRNKPLKTIIVDDYQPYTFVNDKGVAEGFSVDIVLAVAREMGVDVDIRADSWGQAMTELEQGTIDLLPMMAYSVDRDKKFDFSMPHTVAYDAIFLKKGSSGISSLKDLSGKTVIVMNKDSAHGYLLSSGLSKTMRLLLVDSLSEALKQLAAGKGDVAIMPKLVGLVTLQKLGMTDIITSSAIINEYDRSFSFAVKEGNQALLNRLNAGLRIINASGLYDEIYNKWFAHLEDAHIHMKTVLKYSLVILLIWLGFIAWSLVLKRQVIIRTRHLESEIMERKKAEESLSDKTQRLQLATESASLGVWDWDIINNKMTWDERMLELYGLTWKTFPGGIEAWQNGLHPEDRAATIEECQAALRGEKEWDTTIRVLQPDGTQKYIKANGVVLWNSERVPIRMLGVNADVTEYMQASARLKASEQRYRALFDSTLDGIYRVNADGIFTEMNAAGARIFGHELPHEMLGRYAIEYWRDPRDRDIYLEELKKKRSVSAYPMKVRKVNGEFRDLEATTRIIEDGYGNFDGIEGILRDVTERERMQEELMKGNERYALTLQALNDGLWDWNVLNGDAFFSPNYYALLGYADNEFLANYASWRMLVHPEDLEQVEEDLQMSVRSGKGFTIDLRMKAKSGGWKWVSTRGKVVEWDGEGKALRLLGTLSDITERKQAEVALTEKNMEIERFTYTASHDLRSPLVTVKAFLGFLKDDLKKNDQDKVAKDIEFMTTAANKMGMLLDELLEMSRVGRVVNDPVRVTFYELVNEATSVGVGRIVQEKVDLQIGECDIVFFGDRPRLSEIWQNLIENAVKYMGDQKMPRVEIGAEGEGTDTVFFVRDNGMGIDPRFKDRVFELFDKLDPKSEGSGLGLALVKRIVEIYRGRIWVESDGEGKGSCFKFTLPEAMKGR